MFRTALLTAALVAVSMPAFAQAGKTPFCDAVNKKREFCKTAKVDCAFMMGNIDGATLDVVDQIKECQPYNASQTNAPEPKVSPSFTQVVCCMGSGVR